MTRTAIVTDSAADLPPDVARAAGIEIAPLSVSFGDRTYQAGVDLSTEEFWARMTAPDAPFPTTAATSPGVFGEIFERCFAAGADAIVCVDIAETLSGTIRSARIAAEMLPDREIHVVDGRSASMAVGLLAQLGAEMAEAGVPAGEIAATLAARAEDTTFFVVLETLEYLRRGGRISGVQAAVGTLLSVKPIITIVDGHVEQADRVRTRQKGRRRVIELAAARPAERVAIMHALNESAEIETFRDELVAALPGGIDPARVSIQPIGPSIGPHVGPGALGAIVLHTH